MNVSCVLYSNSGYNSTNIPDSPARLVGLTSLTVNALDILQDRFLDHIRVNATWEQVKDVDYCKLSYTGEDWYYSVDGVIMQATDVAELLLTPDFITSTGGVSQLEILDGITERVHVADDSYGKYCEDDSLMTPAEPLKIKTVWYKPSDIDYVETIECTVNPTATKEEKAGQAYYAQGSTLPIGGNFCIVPTVVKNNNKTTYEMDGVSADTSPGTCLYQSIPDELANLRSLGLEQCVLSQVKYPTTFVNMNTAVGTTPGGTQYSYVSKVTGNNINFNMSDDAIFNFVNTQAKNNRINYSHFTKYGLITCAGNMIDANPEDLYHTGAVYPIIKVLSDPHTDGRPYWRFLWMNGEEGSGAKFWRNCIAGMKWKQTPLIYTGASGSELTRLQYNASINLMNVGQESDLLRNSRDIAQGAIETASGMASAVVGSYRTGLTGGLTGTEEMIGGFTRMASGAVETAYQAGNRDLIKKQYGAKRQSEFLNMYINTQVQAPTVNYPYNTEPLRDFYGNGCLGYRYYYSDNDIARIDKLLTMYGYKHSKPLTASDFTNRTKFNFVMCSSITVGGHAQWINDGIAEQLTAGVRVWHVSPDPTHYTDNPITP